MPVGPPVRFNGDPTQTGPLLVAVAAGGILTTTVVEAVFWQAKLFVTVSE
jgi:hypothetical protein